MSLKEMMTEPKHRYHNSVKSKCRVLRWKCSTTSDYAPPYTRNPNLKPVGKGFGFLVFDLKKYIGDMTQLETTPGVTDPMHYAITGRSRRQRRILLKASVH